MIKVNILLHVYLVSLREKIILRFSYGPFFFFVLVQKVKSYPNFLS